MNVYSKRAVVDDVATAGNNLYFGGLSMPDAGTTPWWRMDSGGMYPEGSRSIGTSSCNVAAVYAGNVVIGGQDAATKAYVTWANLPDRPSRLGYLPSVEVGPI